MAIECWGPLMNFDRPPGGRGSVARARSLRRRMTAGELKLWAEVRKLGLNIRRQAPIGPYVVDFVSHSARLVIEVDGPIHDLEDVSMHDAVRTLWLGDHGYRVMRVSSERAYAEPHAVAEEISEVIDERRRR